MRLVKLAWWLILGAVLLIFLCMVVASFLGWHFDVVPTRSMQPAFQPGRMVVSRPAAPEDVEVGDVILFTAPYLEEEARICHRVIDTQESDSRVFFQTKGDAYERPDAELVSSQNLIGKTVFYVPEVGRIAYLSRLHATPVTLMGQGVSVAMLVILATGLAVIGSELQNIGEWALRPESKRRRELVKNRNERLAKRRRRFA